MGSENEITERHRKTDKRKTEMSKGRNREERQTDKSKIKVNKSRKRKQRKRIL
jgi:hypothetical protein